jgi:hypothetical protein
VSCQIASERVADTLRSLEAKVDPSAPIVGPKTMKRGPKSTTNPHKSDLMNALDPRVDRTAVKRSRKSDCY